MFTNTCGGTQTATSAAATLTVAAKSLTGSFTAANKSYDGTTTATVTGRSLSGAVSGDDVSLSGGSATFSDKHVADGKTVTGTGFVLAGSAAGNYSLASSTLTTTADIKALAVTVTADAKSKVYGDGDPALTYEVTSGALASGDSFTGSLGRASGENVGSYAITQSTLSAGSNYTLTFVPANLTINTRPVTVTADAKSKTYGDADPALTYSGALHGTDSFTGSLARVAGENVGSYVITQGTLSAGSNYTLTFVPANLTINARPVTVTADAKSKTYGDADPALTYTGALARHGQLHGHPDARGRRERRQLRDHSEHVERRQQLHADLRRGQPDDQCTAGDGDRRRQEQDVRRRRPGADLLGCAPRHATASLAAWRAWPARTSAATRSLRVR